MLDGQSLSSLAMVAFAAEIGFIDLDLSAKVVVIGTCQPRLAVAVRKEPCASQTSYRHFLIREPLEDFAEADGFEPFAGYET